MPSIDSYGRVAQLRNAVVQFGSDEHGEVLVRSEKPGLLGRFASWLQLSTATGHEHNRAVWQNFADAIRAHYPDEKITKPIIQDLQRAMEQGNPLSTRQVAASLKAVEQLTRFKNEHTVASILNEKSSPDAPPFLQAIMEDAYQDVAAKLTMTDRKHYESVKPYLEKSIVENLVQPEPGKTFVDPDQLRQKARDLVRHKVGFNLIALSLIHI